MRAWSIVAILMLSLAHRAAAADKIDPEVKAHFEEGSKAFSLGEFDRAAAEYRAAFKLKPDASFLYNIAQSYRLGNNLPQALFFYRSYLHTEPDAPNRDEVEDRIHKLETQIAAQHAVTNEPPNTTRPPEPAPKPALVEVTRERPPARQPVYKKWWLWTAVGVVAVGAGVGLGLGLSHQSAPSSQLGNTGVF